MYRSITDTLSPPLPPLLALIAHEHCSSLRSAVSLLYIAFESTRGGLYMLSHAPPSTRYVKAVFLMFMQSRRRSPNHTTVALHPFSCTPSTSSPSKRLMIFIPEIVVMLGLVPALHTKPDLSNVPIEATSGHSRICPSFIPPSLQAEDEVPLWRRATLLHIHRPDYCKT